MSHLAPGLVSSSATDKTTQAHLDQYQELPMVALCDHFCDQIRGKGKDRKEGFIKSYKNREAVGHIPSAKIVTRPSIPSFHFPPYGDGGRRYSGRVPFECRPPFPESSVRRASPDAPLHYKPRVPAVDYRGTNSITAVTALHLLECFEVDHGC